MDLEQALTFTDTLIVAKFGHHLSDLQQAMLRESWSWQRLSYDRIAETYGYSPTYLKHDVGPKLWKLLSEAMGEKVTKTSFRTAIERQFLAEQSAAAALPPTPIATISPPPPTSQPITQQDWGEATDVSFFYGREPELAQLDQWILADGCRVVSVLGLGGMGKTSLAVRLAQRLQEQFDWLIWRSLRNAPPLTELLDDILQVLLESPPSPSPTGDRLTQLINYLRPTSHPSTPRGLLVLDNVEALLQPQAVRRSGSYRPGYEDYGELFRRWGEIRHQSCLVLTSREKPSEIVWLEGERLPVRSLTLNGLAPPEARQVVQLKGQFQASEAEWQQLTSSYSGNPLALKIIATTIQTLFDGNIADFLQQDAFVIGGIRTLIEQQFARLSEIETTILYGLAIYREPTRLQELRTDFYPALAPPQLLEGLAALEQRSLIERQASSFSLQPVVMEYVSQHLINQICAEIQAGLASKQPLLIKRHALLKAQSKDYIRDAQIRLLLNPLLDQLLLQWDTATLIDRLKHLLGQFQGKSAAETGYAGGNLLNLLCQKQPYLQGEDLSQLVLWQADLQAIPVQNVNFANSDLTRSRFTETLGMVFTVALSPDGTQLAIGDAEGGLRLWPVEADRPLLNFEGHQGWVWSVTFSADGQRLASCSSDKTIRIWDVLTGQCLQILRGHRSTIWSIAFHPQGHLLASGGDEPTVMLWDWQTGDCIHQWAGHIGRIFSVAFHPQGHTLTSGGEDGTMRLWEVATGNCQCICQGHTDRIWSVAFSPDGDCIASGSADRTIKLWDVKHGSCWQTLTDHRDRVRSVTFSRNGHDLISSSDDQTIKVWALPAGTCLQTLRGHSSSIFSIAAHPDGQTLVSGSSDQTVRVWNLPKGRCLKTLKGYTNSIFSIAFSADGQTLVSGSTDQTVKIWQVETGVCRQVLQGHQGWVTSVAISPQGTYLASSSADQTVRLWSLATGQCLQTLQGHTNWVQSVCFSPDGSRLASAGDDRTIRLWSIPSGQCLTQFGGHTGWIWMVVFSPTGEMIASSSEDQTIRLWSVVTGDCLQVLQGHLGRVQAIAISPDGQFLASGSGDETIRLWEIASGACVATLQGHHNNVWSVAFSPDGRYLASGSLDQTVRLWDLLTGQCQQVILVRSQSVRSAIAVYPGATYLINPDLAAETPILAGSSHNGTIHLWNASNGACLRTLTAIRPYEGMNIWGVTGLTTAQRLALQTLGAVEWLSESPQCHT